MSHKPHTPHFPHRTRTHCECIGHAMHTEGRCVKCGHAPAPTPTHAHAHAPARTPVPARTATRTPAGRDRKASIGS